MTSPGPLHMSIHPPRSVSLGLLGGGGEGTSLRGRRRDSHYCEESGLTRGLLEPLLSPWQQDNYRIAVKQMEDLNLMENMVRKMQLHQHGPFSSKQLTSDTCSPNLRNATENRIINKHQLEADPKSKDTAIRTFVWSSLFSNTDISKNGPIFYPEPNKLPSELHWSYDDILPAALHNAKNNITASSSYPVTENNSGETLFLTDWNWNSSLVQNDLSDETDLSEGEKEDVFLIYPKQLDLSLRPEVVENIEESCSEVECSTFPYPDFLPEPFNILDLPELALLKYEKWKGIIGTTPESSIGRLLSRLLQMEKMQHLTIQKEKLKASRAHLISAASMRSCSPKAIHKQKYSRQSDLSSVPLACIGHYHEENSSNLSCCKHQQNSSKCSCQPSSHCKWVSRTSCIRDLNTQSVTRASSAYKPSRTLAHSNSHQLILHRPASTHAISQTPQAFVEVTKVKLPSNMGTSYSLALRGTAKYKVPGRKKKSNTNKSKALSKHLQRQNSLPVSCSSKQDLTQTDKC